jgi:hypothetical protein
MATGSDAVLLAWLNWALKAFNEAEDDYQNFEDYYIGDHELAFATDRWKSIFESEFEEFSDNWCGVVIDSLAQRMEIIGWDTDGGDDSDVKIAEEIWDYNHLEVEEEDLTTQTLVKGDGYLMVWPDEDDPTQEVQVVYNDALDVNIYYDPANRRRPIRAAKKFRDQDQLVHIYVYYPDRTEKYVSTSTNPNPFFIVQTESLSVDNLPSGWEKKDDVPNPYGVLPVFHFKNKMVNSTHGISEIKQVIPIQNAVNKLFMDMMIGSEFGSFKQKWMAGGGHPRDGWKSGPERIWATTDPNAKFGEFGQQDIEQYVRVLEMVIAQIAKITQTPMHYLRTSGDMPSGEALKAAESGLVHKAKNRQKSWGAKWSDSMTFAVRIKKGNGETLGTVKSPLKPIWRSAETRHDLEQAQTAQLKAILGIPLDQLWSEHFGYTEDQITEFKKNNNLTITTQLTQILAQSGQLPPGLENAGSIDIPKLLSLLPKSQTSQTSAGEATTKATS